MSDAEYTQLTLNPVDTDDLVTAALYHDRLAGWLSNVGIDPQLIPAEAAVTAEVDEDGVIRRVTYDEWEHKPKPDVPLPPARRRSRRVEVQANTLPIRPR